MADKKVKGFALKNIFVAGEAVAAGQPCEILAREEAVLTGAGKFTKDKDLAAKAKKAATAGK